MIFVKSLTGGVVAAIIAWIIIVVVYMLRLAEASKQRGDSGLGAVAGGWNYLLHMPLVIVLLAAAFGIGVYLTARA